MYKSVYELEKTIINLDQEDKNDQLESLIKQDIEFYERHGHTPCIAATTNSLLERLLKINSAYPSIPSLSSLEEIQSDHLMLIERSRALIVITRARQLVPVNLSIMLQHADLYSVAVLILIDGITDLSNPKDFNATEHFLKEMPRANFKWVDIQSIPEDSLIDVTINQFVESQNIQLRALSLCEQRTKRLLEHLHKRLDYLSNYSVSLSEFKRIVDEYEHRSMLLTSGTVASSKSELYDVIRKIGSSDPDVFINQVMEYDNLENRIIKILQLVQSKIKILISKEIPFIATDLASAINKELTSTEQDLSKLALELSRSLGLQVDLNTERVEITSCYSESFIEELYQVVDELVTAPQLMMLIAKYAESIGSKAADIVESTINRTDSNNNEQEADGDGSTEEQISETGRNQIDTDSKMGQMIRIVTKALPEHIIINQLPNTIREILASLEDGLSQKIDSFVAKTNSEIQSKIPDMYHPIKNVIFEKRYNVQIRTEKINKLVDELL